MTYRVTFSGGGFFDTQANSADDAERIARQFRQDIEGVTQLYTTHATALDPLWMLALIGGLLFLLSRRKS